METCPCRLGWRSSILFLEVDEMLVSDVLKRVISRVLICNGDVLYSGICSRVPADLLDRRVAWLIPLEHDVLKIEII